jgi:hypothetical protein
MLTLTTQLKRVRAAASNLRHTPTKMRRYRTSSWILLIHSIINFTLAVPVTVRDIHGVRINVVDAAKDRVAVLQKRMDPDQGQASGLTSDASDGDERAWRPVFGIGNRNWPRPRNQNQNRNRIRIRRQEWNHIGLGNRNRGIGTGTGTG